MIKSKFFFTFGSLLLRLIATNSRRFSEPRDDVVLSLSKTDLTSKSKSVTMKGATALLPVKNKIMNKYTFKASPGNVETVTTKKPIKNVFGEEETINAKEKADPVVAFSRPPPMPPVLGPVIVLSLLENWLNRDRNDD